MMVMRTVVTVLIVLASVTSYAQEESEEPAVPIEFRGMTVGSIEQVVLETDPSDSTRLTVTLMAAFPGLMRVLDAVIGGRGDLVPGNTIDVRWRRNSTRIRGTSDGGRGLQLRTRFDIRTRVIGVTIPDARNADYTLTLTPDRLRNVRARVEITDIEGWIGNAARAFGLLRDLVQQITFPLLASCEDCMCLQDNLDLSQGSSRFSTEEGIVRLHVTYALDGTLTPGLPCLR